MPASDIQVVRGDIIKVLAYAGYACILLACFQVILENTLIFGYSIISSYSRPNWCQDTQTFNTLYNSTWMRLPNFWMVQKDGEVEWGGLLYL